MTEPPEAIIITISQAMLKERGYRNWLRNYLNAMATDSHTYWMRQGARPKRDVAYVYLCIGGKVRYRSHFVQSHGRGWIRFAGGREMYAPAWIEMCGPAVKAPYVIPMKGFRGFRYTHKLF